MTTLDKDEAFVLGWLGDDDRGGLYGEAQCKALDRLVEKGLARLPEPLSDWGYVTLTEAGLAAWMQLRGAP